MNSTVKKTGWMLLLVAALSATGAVSAQSRYFDSNYGAQQRDSRGDPRGRGADQRQNADRMREEQSQRRNDRMSPDERRALRQQIDEAGRDIYRRR